MKNLNPKRRASNLSIAVPSSLVSEIPHLREKTYAVGQIGRAAAIFRVDDIYIYPDSPSEAPLIRLILSYMETPQYLRKHLFGRRPELEFAGILPPLRTASHPVESRAFKLRVGDVREGVVLSSSKEGFVVDVGVEKPLLASGKGPSKGGRATVEITATEPGLKGVFIGRKDVEVYWGYGVHMVSRRLGDMALGGEFDLSIATSKLGAHFNNIEGRIRSKWNTSKSILIAFGSPRSGLKEILSKEKLTLDETFQFIVNTIPEQGCETVRTEEAVYATLAIFNLIRT